MLLMTWPRLLWVIFKFKMLAFTWIKFQVIWSSFGWSNYAPKWTTPKWTFSSSLDHLPISAHFSQTAGPKLVKLFSLKNRLLKLSYESYFIGFGPETRELWLNESDPAAVSTCGSLEALNARPADSKDAFPFLNLGIQDNRSPSWWEQVSRALVFTFILFLP